MSQVGQKLLLIMNQRKVKERVWPVNQIFKMVNLVNIFLPVATKHLLMLRQDLNILIIDRLMLQDPSPQFGLQLPTHILTNKHVHIQPPNSTYNTLKNLYFSNFHSGFHNLLVTLNSLGA